jgi:ubiquinone/menaquinone biosynthesis C-methylase UbiE
MDFKDYFSKQSKEYSKFRPVYPAELYKYLAGICENHNAAWDCATGNGQAAVALAEYFDMVYATDASEEQIKNAFPHPKVKYSVSLAEKSGLQDNSINLITVATAIHWFSNESFFDEVKRVLTPNGKIATWNYFGIRVNSEINKIIDYFQFELLESYWDERLFRGFKDATAFELPFKKFRPPEIKMEDVWNLDQLLNFLYTWSSVHKYIKLNNKNPIELIYDDLQGAWGKENERKKISWKFLVNVYDVG